MTVRPPAARRFPGDSYQHAASILGAWLANDQRTALQPLDDSGHRRLTEVHGSRDGRLRCRPGSTDLFEHRQLRACQTVAVDQPPRLQVDSANDLANCGDDLIFV